MKNPLRVSGEVRESHVDIQLVLKATVVRYLGHGNHLIDFGVLEICKVD
jgi:hypothetical protein